MGACEGCPASIRFGCEYTEACINGEYEDGKLTTRSFQEQIKTLLYQTGLDSLADRNHCSSIPEIGECMFEPYVRARTDELLPVVLERLDVDANFYIITNYLNGNE